MTRIEITVDRDIFDAINEGAGKAPVLMATALKRTESRWKSRLMKRFRVIPGKPHYPIRWTSERQRRAFFATKGFERGIPTIRTNKMINSWRLEHDTDSDGGVYSLTNDSGYEEFVTGIYQQGFHADTGWYESQSLIADAWVELEDVIIETWFTVTDGIIT